MTSAFESVKAFKDETDATRNNLFAGLRNQDPVAVTSADVLTAAQDATTTQTTVAAVAARLDATLTQAVQGSGGGGNDQFERTDTDLGSDWNVVDTGLGVIVTDGHSATYDPDGSSANRVLARHTGITASSDEQVIRVVLAEPLNEVSSWILLARMNTAQDTYHYGLFRKDYLEIGYVEAGVPTVIDTSTDPFDLPPGATVNLVCFDLGGTPTVYLYSPQHDTAVVGETDSAAIGVSYRSLGFGCDVQPDSGAQVSPGSLALWAGSDNSPDVVGVYFEAHPSTTVTGLATGQFGDAFDTVVRQSQYLSYNDATGDLTVELPGAYSITIYWASATPIPLGEYLILQFWRNGADEISSTPLQGTGGVASGKSHFTTIAYLDAGDVISAAFILSSGTLEMANVSSFRVAKLSPPYFG